MIRSRLPAARSPRVRRARRPIRRTRSPCPGRLLPRRLEEFQSPRPGVALDAPLRELFAAADDAALTCEVRSTFWRLASAVQTEIDLKAGGEERARLETLLGVTIGECESEASRLSRESERLRLALDEKEPQAAEVTAQCT